MTRDAPSFRRHLPPDVQDPAPGPRPRAVVCGMACAASAPPLAALLAAGVEVAALVLAAPNEAPAAGRAPPTIAPGDSPPERVARAAGVPIVPARRVDTALIGRIAAARPDLLVVACFPWRLPPALLAVPRLGGLNVHPSLLPRGRGPEPVFWTLRRGERETGATVHRLDAGLDTGPIVAQRAVAVPFGVRAPELERELMALGGELLVAALPALAAGALRAAPQDDARATPAPVPGSADWLIPTNLPAAWAYAFARGVAPLGGPLAVAVGALGRTIPVRDALDHDPLEPGMEPPVEEGEGTIRVRFRPGSVRFAV